MFCMRWCSNSNKIKNLMVLSVTINDSKNIFSKHINVPTSYQHNHDIFYTQFHKTNVGQQFLADMHYYNIQS